MSGLAVWFLLQQVSLEQLGEVLSTAQPLPIVVLVLAVLGSLVTRALRWQVYFLPERKIAFRPLLETLAISYMASTFLPFRAGEVVRAVLLAQREQVAIPRIVGTILLEKLFDFLAIGVMLVLLLATTPLPPVALVAGSTIAAVILAGFGFVMALALLREPTLRLLGWVERRLPAAITVRVPLVRLAANFAAGTDSLRQPGLWVPLLGWTTVTWICSLISLWAGAVAVGVQATLPAITFTSVLTSTGQAVPSSPGYVGVFHGAATLALTAFGVDWTSALAAAVLIHAFSYGSLVVWGLVALWVGGYGLREVVASTRQPAPSTVPSPRA